MFDPANVLIDIVDSTEKAFDCLRWISDVRTDIIAVDIESDGFDWFDGRMRLVQFGTLTEGWAVPFEFYPGLVNELLEVVERRKLPMVGHNSSHFDFHWLDQNTEWEPKNWGRYHNTMDLAAVIDSSGSKALKDLTTHYIHPVFKLGQTALHDAMKKGGWTWGTVPVFLPEYWMYGVLDTIGTANLFHVLMPKAVSIGVHDAYEVERGCVPALYSMERRGMLVDSDHCNVQLDGLQGRMAEIEQAAHDQYGIENVGSGDQLIRAFLDSGIELHKMTDSGKRYSMSKEAFEDVEARYGKHPLVSLVSEYRVCEKYAQSYYSNFLRFQRSDGRLHPQYNQNQARTGRMSVQHPAIQTIPRPENERAKQVRNSIVCDEGNVLISTDFTNVEARIFAHFAREEGMLKAIRDGIDLHGYTAHQMYGEWPETGVAPKDHLKRQISKSVLFAKLFGAGPAKMAVTAGVHLDQAVEADTKLKAAFPGMKRFQKEVEYMARANLEQTGKAWIRGIDNRILAMKESDDRYYAFTNWLIQGTATVVLKQRLAVIHQMGLSEFGIAAIHDEVVSEVPIDLVDDYNRLIDEAMTDNYQFDVPIVSDTGKPAYRLGEAK